MRARWLPVITRYLIAVALATSSAVPAAAQTAARGTIKGHVKLTGKLPGNPVVRTAADPMCSKVRAGKRLVQETVAANLQGDLANVFVKLDGSFPQTPPPAAPVMIDQVGCVYVPRVIGVQAGQTLQIRNSDALLHNLHSSSTVKDNNFNVGQPIAGIVSQFHLKADDEMVKLRCDVHSWMTSYVGVVNHPYFAVSSPAGSFEIANVPPGSYTVKAWHEKYGPTTQTVRVRAGQVTTVDFSYASGES
jgi:hypothetical protein